MLQEINNRFHKITGKPISTEEQLHKIAEHDLNWMETIVLKLHEAKILANKSKFEEAKKIALNTLKELKGKKLYSLEGFAYKSLSYLSFFIGSSQEQLKYSLKHAELIEKSEPDLFPDRYHNVGFAYLKRREFDKAISSFIKNLKIHEKLNNENGIANSYLMLGETFLNKQSYLKAQKFLIKGIEYCKAIKNEDILLRTMIDYCLTLQSMYKFDDAIKIAQEIISRSDNDKYRRIYGRTLVNLGLCYFNINEYDKAEEHYKKALKVLQEFNELPNIFLVYFHLADLYKKQKKNDLVIKYNEKAYIIADKLNNEYGKRIVSGHLIKYKLENDTFEPGMKNRIESNIEFYKKENDIQKYLHSKNNLATYYFKKNEIKQAYTILKEAYSELNEFYSDQLHVRNMDFYRQLEEAIKHNQRNIELLNPDLQKNIQHHLIGKSEVILKTLETAEKASKTKDTNVLITGESGTGKEILSRLIHYNSERKNNRLITVNCSAVTSTLAESEFFGHTRGSFTGAVRDKMGFFEQADGGTLYLDEIGDMPMTIQSKILRAIESGTITPVGSDREVKVDVRIVASTNKNLYKLVEKNLFRLDLLHRINVIHINVPPLRERKGDLKLLIEYFVDILSKSLRRKKIEISDSFVDALEKYSFPGNIRELRNIIERAIILEPSHRLTAKSLPDKEITQTKAKGAYKRNLNLAEVEKEAVFEALKRCNNSQREAAKLLGLSESALSRKIKKLKNLSN
ncbi:MAG: sigma 54-interacting transcriptional regulator [Candidatus Cloacimonetes bacterium]|nr:sigma 54-interacting transcriptional regulator [Candidatus Cloacimonadota bacterium]MCF7883507.1 sigma 54-interacting transcriptional regulator [Candidatus Cloacimonadota bacterium]